MLLLLFLWMNMCCCLWMHWQTQMWMAGRRSFPLGWDDRHDLGQWTTGRRREWEEEEEKSRGLNRSRNEGMKVRPFMLMLETVGGGCERVVWCSLKNNGGINYSLLTQIVWLWANRWVERIGYLQIQKQEGHLITFCYVCIGATSAQIKVKWSSKILQIIKVLGEFFFNVSPIVFEVMLLFVWWST